SEPFQVLGSEPPQPQSPGSGRLKRPRRSFGIGPGAREILLLGREEVGTVEREEPVADPDRFPRLRYDERFDVRLVLECDVGELTLVDIDSSESAKQPRELAPLDSGEAHAHELLPVR